MNKIARFIIPFLAVIFAPPSLAENNEMWGEIGVTTTKENVSSSPVAGFSASNGSGLGIKIGREIKEIDNLSGFVGVETGSRKLSLTGVNLGNVDSTTFSGGVQYRFETSDWFKPYIRGGVHYSSFEGTLANNTVRLDSSHFGLMAGIGGTFFLDKTSLRNDFIDTAGIGVTQYWHSSTKLKTTAGADVSNITFGGPIFGLWVGRSWK